MVEWTHLGQVIDSLNQGNSRFWFCTALRLKMPAWQL